LKDYYKVPYWVAVIVEVSAIAAVLADISELPNRIDVNTNNDITESNCRFINISNFLLI
jgi:hypothetical protein